MRSIIPKLDVLKILLEKAAEETFWCVPGSNCQFWATKYTFLTTLAYKLMGYEISGGCMAYVREGTPYRLQGLILVPFSTESCVIKISLRKCKKLLIWTIYHVPDLNIESFIKDMDTTLSALPDNIEFISLGDFNFNFTGTTRTWIMVQPWNVNWIKWQILTNVTSSSTNQHGLQIDHLLWLIYCFRTQIIDDWTLSSFCNNWSFSLIIFFVPKSGVTKAPGKTI